MKIRVNSPCPCGSKMKYKSCCQKYHKGTNPKDALTLMKSRYSAYVIGDAKYIMKTTHPENPDYHDNKAIWQKDINSFCQKTDFLSLEIESSSEDSKYAYVTFKAFFSEGVLYEKSRFKKENIWLYLDGEFKE